MDKESPSPSRAVYIHTQAFGVYDAGSVFVANTLHGLASAGAECLLVAPMGDEAADLVLEKMGLKAHPRLAVRLIRDFRVPAGPFRPSWSAPFRRKAAALARDFDADFVLCRDLKMAALLIRKRFGGRIIYEAHNLYGLGGLQSSRDSATDAAFFPEEKLLRHRLRKPLEDRVFRRVDGVITLTRGLAELLVKTRPLSQRVIGIATASRPLEDPPGGAGRRHIAYVGALDPHKGVGTLVGVLDQLPESTRLLIFGTGRHAGKIKELARTAGVLDRIDFTGFVVPGQLPVHLARCRAGVVPLVDCFFNRYVSCPMKVFDYLASGVSPVVPDLPVFREIFEDDSPAVFFQPDEPESLARALKSLFDDDGTFRRRHLAALRHAAAWTWKDRGEKILSFVAGLSLRSEP